jgi:hypothetical protein
MTTCGTFEGAIAIVTLAFSVLFTFAFVPPTLARPTCIVTIGQTDAERPLYQVLSEDYAVPELHGLFGLDTSKLKRPHA